MTRIRCAKRKHSKLVIRFAQQDGKSQRGCEDRAPPARHKETQSIKQTWPGMVNPTWNLHTPQAAAATTESRAIHRSVPSLSLVYLRSCEKKGL